MGSLLLGIYIRFFNWVASRLQTIINYPEDYVLSEELMGIQKLYLGGATTEQIAERYPAIHPELIHLLVDKLAAQDGCLDYMTRTFSALMR